MGATILYVTSIVSESSIELAIGRLPYYKRYDAMILEN